MSTDIRVTLGKVRTKAIENASEAQSTGTEIALLGNRKLAFGDIHLEECAFKNRPNRDYSLFSFLSGVRGNLRPMVDIGKLREQTQAFLDWITQEWLKTSEGMHQNEEDYLWGLGLDHCSRTFYPVDVLLNFNYDQIAMVLDLDGEYVPDTDSWTYRQYFGSSWFDFLDYLKRGEWDFVIFSYD